MASSDHVSRILRRVLSLMMLTRAPQGTKHRGLIRLMTSQGITRLRDGTTDVTGLLELGFLGQREMFPNKHTEL